MLLTIITTLNLYYSNLRDKCGKITTNILVFGNVATHRIKVINSKCKISIIGWSSKNLHRKEILMVEYVDLKIIDMINQ